MNDLQQKPLAKPKRRSVAAALAAGKFGEVGDSPSDGIQVITDEPRKSGEEALAPSDLVPQNVTGKPSPDGEAACISYIPLPPQIIAPTAPEPDQPKTVVISTASENQGFNAFEMGRGEEDQGKGKPPHQASSSTPSDILTGKLDRASRTPLREFSEREQVKTPLLPKAGRRERGQSQVTRRNRTFRASDAEFDVLFDILEQVRRSRRLTRSQANRVETSTVIRAALRHVAKTPIDAILDEIIEREDFVG